MIALGLESATELVGAAVADDVGLRAELWSTGRRRHVESLAPAVEAVLASADIGLGALEAVVVDVGPGLFTGLRVGVATAQGLALGLGVGVLAVSSLEVLAAQALAAWPGVVLSVVDARRGEVFVAAYEGDGRLPRELLPPALHSPEDLAGAAYEARAAASAASAVLVVGDGARRYAHELADADVVLAGAAFVGPSPGALVTLGVARLAAGVAPGAPETLQPLYLRPPDAQINWVQRPPMEPTP